MSVITLVSQLYHVTTIYKGDVVALGRCQGLHCQRAMLTAPSEVLGMAGGFVGATVL